MRLTRTALMMCVLLEIAGCNPGVKNSSETPATDAAQQSGTSTFSYSMGEPDCGLNVQSVNTKFSLATVSARNAPTHQILLKEQFSQKGCTNSEGLKGSVEISGWLDQFEAGRAPSWQAHAEGHEGEIDGPFYRATKHGCCGSTAASVYINLLSGKNVFESTLKLIRIEVPNTDVSRYIGFLDTWSISTPEESKSDSSVIGALQYGSSEIAQDRVLIKTNTSNPFSIEDLAVATTKEPSKFSESLDLWSADGKEDTSAITGFIIRAKLIEVGGGDRQLTVTIPVVEDRLDLDHATVTKGVELVRAKAR
jgi:hypothetical protein